MHISEDVILRLLHICIPPQSLFFHHISKTPRQVRRHQYEPASPPSCLFASKAFAFFFFLPFTSCSLQTEPPAWNDCGKEQRKVASFSRSHFSLCITYPCLFQSPLAPPPHGSMHCFFPPFLLFIPRRQFRTEQSPGRKYDKEGIKSNETEERRLLQK